MVFGIWRNGHFMNCHSMYFYPTVITNLFMYTSLPSKYLLSWGVFLKRGSVLKLKRNLFWPTSLKQHYNLAKRGKGLAEFYQIGQVLFGLWEVIPGHHVTIKSYHRKCLNPPWLSQTVAQIKNQFVFLKISNNYALFNFILASIGIGCMFRGGGMGVQYTSLILTHSVIQTDFINSL